MIAVVLLGEYLSGCRCDMWEGNGVKKGVLDGRFDSGMSIFVLCVCVELGEPACTKLGTTFFAEWCYSVDFRQRVLGMMMKT